MPGPMSTASGVHLVEYDKYIENQLRKTAPAGALRRRDRALLVLVAGSLIYLFAMALVDHWLVTGGMGYAGRTVAWAVYLTGLIAWCGYALVPLVFWRINPIYAAHTIEQNRPTLKNSVVNFLMLRERPERISRSMFEALERQAATGLSQVTIEHAVDRSKLVILGWALLAIVAICAIYKVASPKDPLRSFSRVIAPWANIAAPTRVVIGAIEPGDTKAFREHFVTVKAQISGLAASEEVTLFYSTADGQVVDKAVPMNSDGLEYKAELPPHQGGLQQDIEYWLAAGDARSEHYHVKTLATPSIVVDRVDYTFPAYTEMDPRSTDRQGDVSAIEGTRVTVHATANDDIKAASVDFECDGRRDMGMQINAARPRPCFSSR